MAAHAELAHALPPHHRDPFDRMLVAQAQLEALVLYQPATSILTYYLARDVSLPHTRWERHRGLLTAPAVDSQDRFVKASESTVGGGVLRIRVENQGCAEWGLCFDDDEGDPQVWIKVGDGPYQQDKGTLSSSLIVSVSTTRY